MLLLLTHQNLHLLVQHNAVDYFLRSDGEGSLLLIKHVHLNGVGHVLVPERRVRYLVSVHQHSILAWVVVSVHIILHVLV